MDCLVMRLSRCTRVHEHELALISKSNRGEEQEDRVTSKHLHTSIHTCPILVTVSIPSSTCANKHIFSTPNLCHG